MKKLARKQFETAVQTSQLNPYARFILMTYAARNDYNDEAQESYISKAKIAEWTGINKDTVSDYVEALEEDGWLIPAQMHGRTQGYYLAEGVLMNRTLKKATRGKNLPQKESNLLMEPRVSPDGADTYLLMEPTLSPDGQELRTNKNPIEEPKKEPHPASPVGLQEDESSISLSNDSEEPLNTEGKKEALEGLSKRDFDRVYSFVRREGLTWADARARLDRENDDEW